MTSDARLPLAFISGSRSEPGDELTCSSKEDVVTMWLKGCTSFGKKSGCGRGGVPGLRYWGCGMESTCTVHVLYVYMYIGRSDEVSTALKMGMTEERRHTVYMYM